MEEKNRIADELLQELGQQISKARFNEMKVASEETFDKREAIDIKKSRKMQKRWLKVCAIFLCVLISITAITTVTSEAFRMNVFGFFFEEKDGHADLIPSDALQIMYPSYLPDGYKKVSEDNSGDSLEISYQHENNNDFISIFEGFSDSVKISIDTETTKREQCMVGIYKAYYFSPVEEMTDDTHILIWRQDDVYIEIIATLEKEEMIKIGASLK